MVQTEAFLDLSPTALELVIGRDNFSLANNYECHIHDICVKWAQSQLKKQAGIDSASDLQVREHLGAVLYRIRYPIMPSSVFSNTGGISEIISLSEQSEVYFYIANRKKKNGMLAFDSENRQVDCFVERYQTVVAEPWHTVSTMDAIQFTTNRNLTLSAVGLYAGHRNYDYVTTINIQEGIDIISRTTTLVHTDKTSNIVKVALHRPITLRAGILYTVWTPTCSQMYGSYGNQGWPTCATNGVTLTFTACTNPVSMTTIETGQLPRLYFSIDSKPIEDVVVERYKAVAAGPWDSSANNGDEIQFTANEDVYLVAIGLYAGLAGAEYDVNIKIMKHVD